jgi:tRNA(Ile2) C34 agmatinyltransferase TiaS
MTITRYNSSKETNMSDKEKKAADVEVAKDATEAEVSVKAEKAADEKKAQKVASLGDLRKVRVGICPRCGSGKNVVDDKLAEQFRCNSCKMYFPRKAIK